MSETLINLLVDQGVTVAMLFWFMFRMEKTQKDNTSALTNLEKAISALQEKLK